MDLKEVVDEVETLWLCSHSEEDISKFNEEVSPEIIHTYCTARKIANMKQDVKHCLLQCEATLEALWEQLNKGHWSEVPDGPRYLYARASQLKALLLLRQCWPKGDIDLMVANVKAALRACDLGLLLGVPNFDLRQVVTALNFAELTWAASCPVPFGAPEATSMPDRILDVSADILSTKGLPPALSIRELNRPSIRKFHDDHFGPRKPLVMKNCIEHWRARKTWCPEYFKQIAGGRTVPVELGVHYADDKWSQQLMTMREFVDKHMLSEKPVHKDSSKAAPLGYLAQHRLFDQMPELCRDIDDPDYCCLRDNDHDPSKELNAPEVNAWFGPAGTISPLHFDPKHNILAQVKGFKRVWLFAPKDSEYLYPHESATLLSNTAQVDPEKPDLTSFPKYANAKPMRCTLAPGHCIYIPPRWWHHVRALTPSMSVSYWWE